VRIVGRAGSPGLQWHREYTHETCQHSRVLMIDYIRKGKHSFVCATTIR
jgi:hypothetical protein